GHKQLFSMARDAGHRALARVGACGLPCFDSAWGNIRFVASRDGKQNATARARRFEALGRGRGNTELRACAVADGGRPVPCDRRIPGPRRRERRGEARMSVWATRAPIKVLPATRTPTSDEIASLVNSSVSPPIAFCF